MVYKLLGWVVWKGVKWLLRGRYGAKMLPLPVWAGGGLLAVVGVALAVKRAAQA